MPPSKNDQAMNLLVKSATKRYHEKYKVRLIKGQLEAEQSKEWQINLEQGELQVEHQAEAWQTKDLTWPFLTAVAKEEALDWLVKNFWMDTATPEDNDYATPIADDIIMLKMKEEFVMHTLYFKITYKALVSTISQSFTALESVHKWISLCCMSRVATSFFASAKPISAANNSMRGMVWAALTGFNLDLAWTNLSTTFSPAFRIYATAE
jgi:hypothetical protein